MLLIAVASGLSLANTILVTLYIKTVTDGDETVKCTDIFMHISLYYNYRDRTEGSGDSEILHNIEDRK
jgi:hypothetical protein